MDSAGLSPHIRGNERNHESSSYYHGSIPAHTGERRKPRLSSINYWVYPRTYGGTCLNGDRSFPRWGLSPHIRGNDRFHQFAARREGSIPAHTGERVSGTYPRVSCRVYPRTYGGTPLYQFYPRYLMGLSPHIRGNAARVWAIPWSRGSIPAHTGERQSSRSRFVA